MQKRYLQKRGRGKGGQMIRIMEIIVERRGWKMMNEVSSGG